MLNAVIRFALTYRLLTVAIAIVVAAYGGYVMYHLPVDVFPDLDRPRVTVLTEAPGLAPEEVETLVTRPLEEAVGIVSGVKRLTSISRPGLSQVTMEFDWGRNMDFAALDVRQKLDLVTLPRPGPGGPRLRRGRAEPQGARDQPPGWVPAYVNRAPDRRVGARRPRCASNP